MRFLFASLIILQLFLSATASGQNRDEKLKVVHERLYRDVDQIGAHIKRLVDDLAEGVIVEIDNERIYSKTVLGRFYEHMDFAPAWENPEALSEAIEALKGSLDEGLLPEDYHLDVLISIVEKLVQSDPRAPVDYEWVAKFDLLLTDAIFLYGYHLVKGKVDPHSLDLNWNFAYGELPGGDGLLMAQAIEELTILEELHKLRPQIPDYPDLMRELAEYRVIAEYGGWGEIKAGGKIDPGDSDPRIVQIRSRLEITGDLNNLNDMDSDVYDASLEKDVRYFQDRHGLENDGIIGKGTFAAMNIPVEVKIDQIRINLERFRWVTHNLSEKFLVVNIARFRAYLVENSRESFGTNVMVGTEQNKTPVFKSQLQYIEFNPTWTIPRSITVKETIPKIKKDHNYLSDRNMVLLNSSGEIVPMSSVDFSAMSSNNFPLHHQAGTRPRQCTGGGKIYISK